MLYDVDEMNIIGAEINRQIKEYVVYNISVEDVIEGVQQLKLDKSDGEEGLSSDLIHGPRILYVLLTLVFNCMLLHRYDCDYMLVGTMVPISHDKKQLDNFRAVTLSGIVDIVAKLFGVIILSRE